MRARYALVPDIRLHAAPSALHHARLRAWLHLALPPCAPIVRASDALHFRATWSLTLLLVRPFAPCRRLLWPLLTSRSVSPRRPFRRKARSPQVRTHSFAAQPPDLRRFALIMRASRFLARSLCSATPSIRFLSIGSQLMLHASSPRSVTLTQLRFTSFAVINLRRDLHPQECAHAGRTREEGAVIAHRAFSCKVPRLCRLRRAS